ncbi:hypothetical protein [Streptomyces sp. NPDC014793]|uniref:hypothetical protein n=1 Tax=Streptomyces sp. NPDC014793 TaxID=3364914 RepID=UPI0036FDE99F
MLTANGSLSVLPLRFLAADGADFLRAAVDRGLLFDREGPDPADYLKGYGLFGQAAPLQQFWPQLAELTAEHPVLSQHLGGLKERVLITQVPSRGFAAGVKGFPDGSQLIQFHTGLFSTVALASQLLAKISLYDPPASVPEPDSLVEAVSLLELLLAEYRLLNHDVSPKILLQPSRHAQVAGELAHAAEAFALTHEVAHVLLRHTQDDWEQAPKRSINEITADVLALQILSGVYAAGPPPTLQQQLGRLLGIRLLISCLELYEQAVFVRCKQTHPPAADRWAVIRKASEQLYQPRVLAEVDYLWSPFSTLIRRVSDDAPSLQDVHSALNRIAARDEFTAPFDWRQAVGLVSLYRRTNTIITDPDAIMHGRRLADAAQMKYPEPAAVTWQQLFTLQIQIAKMVRPETLNPTATGAVITAAHSLRERTS